MTQLKNKLIKINSLLRSTYGPKKAKKLSDPLDTLIATILSQNTTDKNSIPAFNALKKRYPSWKSAGGAKAGEIGKIIKPAGLFRTKSKRIKNILGKTTNLNFLRKLSAYDAANYLENLKGVGPKTLSCVMLFSLGKPYFPVDTHILRIGKRLGLLSKDADDSVAHDFFAKVVPHNIMYELHLNMIEHGRRTCSARRPKCLDCKLREFCRYYKTILTRK
jgi:endonuclease-3